MFFYKTCALRLLCQRKMRRNGAAWFLLGTHEVWFMLCLRWELEVQGFEIQKKNIEEALGMLSGVGAVSGF